MTGGGIYNAYPANRVKFLRFESLLLNVFSEDYMICHCLFRSMMQTCRYYKKETKKFNFVSLFMHIDIKLHHQMNHFHTNSLYETLFPSWIHTTNRI